MKERNEMKVDYFFKELKGMNITEAIRYLIKMKYSLLYSVELKKLQIADSWKKFEKNK